MRESVVPAAVRDRLEQDSWLRAEVAHLHVDHGRVLRTVALAVVALGERRPARSVGVSMVFVASRRVAEAWLSAELDAGPRTVRAIVSAALDSPANRLPDPVVWRIGHRLEVRVPRELLVVVQ